MIVECLADGCLALFLVVEEHEVLGLFLVGTASHIDGLHSVGVDAGVVHLGGERHRSGCEILYLLETVAEFLHRNSQVCHISDGTARMGADEIRNELITESGRGTDAVEVLLGAKEKVERGLSHDVQYPYGGVFGSNL